MGGAKMVYETVDRKSKRKTKTPDGPEEKQSTLSRLASQARLQRLLQVGVHALQALHLLQRQAASLHCFLLVGLVVVVVVVVVGDDCRCVSVCVPSFGG